jgi:hypothetical protein
MCRLVVRYRQYIAILRLFGQKRVEMKKAPTDGARAKNQPRKVYQKTKKSQEGSGAGD